MLRGPVRTWLAASSEATLTDDGPHAVLLTDVVRAGTERLFTADREAACVHEVAEEFPACSVGQHGTHLNLYR